MAVLILGATGFLGPAVAEALAGKAEVVAASRGGEGPLATSLDRRDVRAVLQTVRERQVTAVIDLLAYTQADTLPLLSALKGEISRWVMASSSDVYQNYDGFLKKSTDRPVDAPLSEMSPLRTSRFPYRSEQRRDPAATDAWMDEYDKIPLEAATRETFENSAAILRLPMFYGPGDRNRRFRWIIRPMLEGSKVTYVDPAWGRYRTTYGYVADVGDALAAAALHPMAGGKTFNIGEASGPDHFGWINRVADVMTWEGKVEELDAPRDGPLSKLDLRYSLETDTQAFRQDCNWTEPTPLREALLRTIAGENRV